MVLLLLWQHGVALAAIWQQRLDLAVSLAGMSPLCLRHSIENLVFLSAEVSATLKALWRSFMSARIVSTRAVSL